jgi:hypothetical protein
MQKKPREEMALSLRVQELMATAFQADIDDAKAAGQLGFVARTLVQATMPHSKVTGAEYTRKNGKFRLTMLSPSVIGLPYGPLPRLLMAWITNEAVKTKQPKLILGDSLSEFMRELKIVPTGGRWGSITRLKNQMKRLMSCAISCTYDDGKRWTMVNMTPVEVANLWWDPVNPAQKALWESTLTLNKSFFEEITHSPIPIRMSTLEALRGSSMALDVYCWLTYRNSYAKRPSNIPWQALQMQFGAGYPMTQQGKWDFKRFFLVALKRVGMFYTEAQKLEANEDFLFFVPGRPDVPKKESNLSTKKRG